mgnify:CR=1 FL=1
MKKDDDNDLKRWKGRGAVTPFQRKLARHALGLPNDRKQSYRNRYYSAKEGEAASAWADLVAQGLAARDDAQATNVCFYLTGSGALAALDPGESLDREDFSAVVQSNRGDAA